MGLVSGRGLRGFKKRVANASPRKWDEVQIGAIGALRAHLVAAMTRVEIEMQQMQAPSVQSAAAERSGGGRDKNEPALLQGS